MMRTTTFTPGQRLRLVATVGLSLSLAACTSTRLAPQAVDSPLPSNLKDRLAESCLAVKQLDKPGDHCWLIVQSAGDPIPPIGSSMPGNPTGLQVQAAEAYSVQVDPAQQFWYDATRRVAAPDGDDGSGFMKAMGFMKIHRQEKWFALMARVEPDCKPPAACPARPTAQAIKSPNGHYKASASGQLVLYVNDAQGFYGNNQGRIRVTITRL